MCFRLYNAGLQPKIKNLYPSVSYPVSRSTPMIQSLIEWDHSAQWAVAEFSQKVKYKSSIPTYIKKNIILGFIKTDKL